MSFNTINEKIIIVVTNYLYNSVAEFESDENCKLYMSNYHLEKELPIIQSGNNPIPTPILQQIQSNLPIATYKTSDNRFKLTYNDLNKNITFEISEINDDSIIFIKKLVDSFVDLKMSDVKAIGLNFISQFDLGNNKLKILNDKIETYMPNFKKNRTFQLTLLLQLDDCVATYKIRKLSGGDDSGENRIYQIDSNFHFDVSLGTTQEKINKISAITDNLSRKYLSSFKNECNNILGMNDGQEEKK